MPAPFFSVVIPSFNATQALARCLQSIDALDYAHYECIVVDDGSTDDTASVVARHRATYVRQPNQGPAAARNRGIEEAQGEFIFFTDSDCVVPLDTLAKYAQEFEARGDVAGIGGGYRTLNRESTVARYVGYEISYRHRNQVQAETRAIGTYNAVFKRNILRQMGGFDTTFKKASGEDFELCYRLVKAGHRLGFAPDIFVWHEHPDSTGQYFRQQIQRGKTRLKNVLEHRGLAVSDQYVEKGVQLHPPLIALAVLSLAAGLFFPPLLLVLGACILGICGLNTGFIRFVWREEAALVPLTLVLVLIRPMAWTLGAADTLIKEGWRRLAGKR